VHSSIPEVPKPREVQLFQKRHVRQGHGKRCGAGRPEAIVVVQMKLLLMRVCGSTDISAAISASASSPRAICPSGSMASPQLPAHSFSRRGKLLTYYHSIRQDFSRCRKGLLSWIWLSRRPNVCKTCREANGVTSWIWLPPRPNEVREVREANGVKAQGLELGFHVHSDRRAYLRASWSTSR